VRDLRYAEIPSYGGFWSEKLFEARSLDYERKVVDGVEYNAALIKRMALFPVRSGELRVDAMKLTGSVVTGGGMFGFFGRGQEVSLSSGALTIDVLPLPDEGAPEGFSGTVGDYSISAALDRDTSDGGEPLELTVTVTGTGNLRTLDRPELIAPPGLKILDPEVGDRIQTSGRTVKGTKTFKFPVIPEEDGRHRLEPVRMAFFDPEREAYRIAETDPIFVVARGASTAEAVRGPGQGLRVLGGDIVHIKADARSLGKSAGTPIWLLALYPVGLLVLLGSFGYRRHQTRMRGDQAYARRLRSKGVAKRRLSEASGLLKEGRTREFYSALARAILGFAGDRYDLEAAALTREVLRDRLLERGAEPEAVDELVDLLHECDEASYSPLSREADARNALGRAWSIVEGLR
jgi:hypothetical protein